MTVSDGPDGAPNHGFRGLRVWQEAVALTDDVEAVVGGFPSERASLADQMRRAARSVHANIAEGSGRHSKREFARALDIARGSLRELESDLLTLESLSLADRRCVSAMHQRVKRVGSLLAGLIHYLRPDE